MTPDGNIQLIQHLFEAFSRGDAGAVLAALTCGAGWRGRRASTPDLVDITHGLT